MWQSAWAFWLVSDGHHDEAQPILDDNLARWSAVARPGDRWLAQMRAINTCAAVQRLLAGPTPPDASGVALLRQAETALREAETLLFTGSSSGGPLHQLVLRTLVRLYDSGPLASARDKRPLEKKLKSFTD
jgi:hypothetical protein